MSTRIMIVGTSPFDSGKTTFTGLLFDEICRRGQRIEYFKPISAHNYWQRFSHTQDCVRQKKLFSADLAYMLAKYNTQLDEYILNPIHRMYVPIVSEKPLGSVPSTLGLAGPDSVIAIQRFSRPLENGIETTTLAAEHLIEQGHLLLTTAELEALTSGTERVPIRTFEEIQRFENDVLEVNVNSSFKKIEERAEIVLIESFNDTVWTWEGLNKVDAVLVVGPGQVFSFDPERFRKAAFLQKRPSMPIREVTFNRINDLLKVQSLTSWSPTGIENLTEVLKE